MHGPWDPTDSRNLFIHGLLAGHGGTCISLPVLYLAIGRRLGYPLRLVRAKEHTFCRWEDSSGERFNIEATSLGFSPRTDDYYLTWPKPLTQQDLAGGFYLRSLSAREELAGFLADRGSCRMYHFHTAEAMQAFYYAAQLSPAHRTQWALSILIHRAVERIRIQGADSPNSRRLQMPAPQEDWEYKLYPIAEKKLNEIFSAHRVRTQRDSSSEAFAAAADAPTGLVYQYDTFS